MNEAPNDTIRLDPAPILKAHPFVAQILQRLAQAGFDAVLVGGVVRDALRATLRRHPSPVPQEVDIATQATPAQVQSVFADWSSQAVGKAFGVILLTAPDGQSYEIATFRTESEYDGRKPGKVQWADSWEQDVRRRDFTVNGLAARLDGRILDEVGGVADLKANVIRTIGSPAQRFCEDSLRLLRLVRFACVLDARVDPDTATAARTHAGGLRRISAERVRGELLKILATNRAHHGIKLMDQLQLLPHSLPEISALKGVPQPPEYHPEGDVYTHTLLALSWADRLAQPALTKLGVLLHDIGKPQALKDNQGQHMGGHDRIGESMVEGIGKRLRFSRADIQCLRFAVRYHMWIAQFPLMGTAKRLRWLQRALQPATLPQLNTLLGVLLCDAQASAHRASAWLPVFEQLGPDLLQLRQLAARERAKKLLDGHDVLALGVQAGPRVGQLLSAVYERILEGTIHTRKEALALAKELIKTRAP